VSSSLIDLAASHAGITPEQAGRAITSALRSLHKVALTDPKGLTAVALESRLNFGAEACYHLFGLLEEERLRENHDLPWSETLLRLDSRMHVYRALVDLWLAGGGDHEPAPSDGVSDPAGPDASTGA
jgi:hypothetical protein